MAQTSTKAAALQVLRRLRKAGFQALLAGGCVRDMLLGRRSSDYDVATDARPDQVRRLFRHVLLIGAKFGVAMVMIDSQKVEVTTFRSDLDYADGRRPEGVIFTTPRQDALRRDFTINGMFYDPQAREIIDYVGGQKDLRRGVVRTIGSPDERFGEDYLRMLRAVRFAVRLGFVLDPATARAVRKLAPRIVEISGERILDELGKMLVRDSAASALRLLHKLNLARAIVSDLFAQGDSPWQAAVARTEALPGRRDLTLALGALLCGLDEKAIANVTRRWGGSNDIRQAACWFSRNLRLWDKAEDIPLAELKRLMAGENFVRLRAIWRAEEKRLTGRQVHARRLTRRIGTIAPSQVAPPPLVTGEDLKAMGLREGPQIGLILRRLYNAQLDERLTSREQALTEVRNIIG